MWIETIDGFNYNKKQMRKAQKMLVTNNRAFNAFVNFFEPLGPETVTILFSTFIDDSFGNDIFFFPIFDIKIPYRLPLHLNYFF